MKNALKILPEKPEWKEVRCPRCNSLMFEINEHFHKQSVRVKCRKCKEMLIL
jgi:phage FluMu protein Com